MSLLGKLVSWGDDRLRFCDLRLHRTCGGLLSGWCIERHSPGVLVLPALICGIVVTASPVPDRRLLYAAITTVIVFAVLALLTAWTNKKEWPLVADLAIQIVVVGVVCLVVWKLGGRQFQVNALYRHTYIPAVGVILISLAIAPLLAWFLFKDFFGSTNNLQECLKRTELFAGRGAERATTLAAILRSLLTVPLRTPHQLLIFPAIAALLVPMEWLRIAVIGFFIFAFVALFFGGLNDRFGTMWSLFQGAFFRGGAFLVSVLVIVIAVLRIENFSYVKTVLDTAADHVIAFTLFSAYVLSWWFDYWVGRLLAQQALGVIAGKRQTRAGIDYTIDCDAWSRSWTGVENSVPKDHRKLQVHGSSRLIVIRPAPDEWFKNYFQANQIVDVMDMLAIAGAPGGKANPLPIQIRERSFDYRALVAAIVLLLAGAGMWYLHNGNQSPETTATTTHAPGISLSAVMQMRCKAGRPVVVIAASGGGTRAALYTASVLEALNDENVLGDVSLGSGVSGGGAALADFASDPQRLIGHTTQQKQAWEQYFETLEQPFIRDVLVRASEWRMASDGRLGMLLRESFTNRWQLKDRHQTLGDVASLGLILNTSVAGHFDANDVSLQDEPRRDTMPLIDLERRHRELTKSELAGGRLIFTNLNIEPGFVGEALEPHGEHSLPIFVNDPKVRLEVAAALNANFPPVFSNSAVDVDDKVRYWVTDGGVVDNRGMEMALYAVRASLDKVECDKLPRLYIIVADASAYSDAFSQNRGVGTMTAAGTKFASQLALEIKLTIEAKYKEHKQGDDFSFSYLSMPQILRASDSFGTHWMLQPSITVHHLNQSSGMIEKETVSGQQMACVMRSLYRDNPPDCRSSAASRILGWVREETDDWKKLQKKLRQEPTTPSPLKASPVP